MLLISLILWYLSLENSMYGSNVQYKWSFVKKNPIHINKFYNEFKVEPSDKKDISHITGFERMYIQVFN